VNNKRTESQNNYYFKCIVLVLGKELGMYKFEMHNELKRLFITDTSKELTKQEFNEYCEQIRIWALADLGILLEEPKK
jgi:hypothetical protein